MNNIIITGFMGTGKTTVGRVLEKKLNMKLIDTDKIIEERAGLKISEIFETKGEAHFRKLESDAIRMSTMRDNQIIATGGGAIVNEDNLEMMRSSGKVISLLASTDTIIDRVSGNDERPLLSGKDLREEIEKLLDIRMRHYKKADIMINTDQMTPDEVAEEIEAYITKKEEIVRVDLDCRSYDIKIGSGLISTVGNELVKLGYSDRVVIITNSAIDALYGDALRGSITDAGISVETIEVQEGESSKSLTVANEVITRLLELKCERSTPLIALGGGVIGDLTGFIASIYLRGVPFIQVPTTLLAQVDSSVGGKTGVNHKLGKNLIGSFYQPQIVVIDIDALKTLKEEEFLNGISEIIKYGVIKDSELFKYLKENSEEIISIRECSECEDTLFNECEKAGKKILEHMIHIIKRSCEIKAQVVSADERESGLRAILNYGHTLGHALEANSDYKGIKHGRAVSIGMIFAARLANKAGLCDKSTVDDTIELISMYDIDTNIDIKETKKIIETMRLDKKVKKGNIKFVLPKKIGEVNYDVDISESDIEGIIKASVP